MKNILLLIVGFLPVSQLSAQNLVVNPNAESLPRGTGWTVISEGALACALTPTNNLLNWTMKPDGSANYPYDHTTGAAGGTVFFSGCDTYFQGPFELQQTIDVSVDAVTIDAGNKLYAFSGYMQTPVSPQTDRGRFIVDFLDTSNSILGTSYTSGWHSNFGGSGDAWNYYSNTRVAPVGTRKIMIRMQTDLFINQPAINVYFDDISLTKPTIVPLGLLSFTGKETGSNIYLNWEMSGELNCKQFELERSTDATNFNGIVTLPADRASYYFVDENRLAGDKYFYRIKMTTIDGIIAYSNILAIRTTNHPAISLSPNPANDMITVAGLSQPGMLSVINYNGSTMLAAPANSPSISLNISKLPNGLYMVRYDYQKSSIIKKLLIQHK